MRGEPATERQMSYVQGLVARLRRMLDDGTDITEKLDQAAHATLSKKDAHDLIDALKGAIAQINGDGPPDGASNVVAFPTVSPKLTPYEENHRQLREREAALNRRQDAWFGEGEMRRAAPPGKNYIKVWQEQRNRVGYRFREPDVLSGWVWECRHSSHANIKSGCVRGGSQLGRKTTLDNAQRHWDKYHRDSENAGNGS